MSYYKRKMFIKKSKKMQSDRQLLEDAILKQADYNGYVIAKLSKLSKHHADFLRSLFIQEL